MKRRIVGFALTAALVFGGTLVLENSPEIVGAPAVVAHADTTPDTGKLGTCDYTFTSDGVLHIGAGTLPESPENTQTNRMYPKVSPFNDLIKGRQGMVTAISFDGMVKTPADASYLFQGLDSVNEGKGDYPVPNPQIKNWQNLDTSQTTDMTAMFMNSGQQTLDVSNFDTSQVTSMCEMFKSNNDLTSNIVGLTSKSFDTSRVTNMASMFENIGNGSFQVILDLSNFDVSKVNNDDVYKDDFDSFVGFGNMFKSSIANKLIVDLSNWKPSISLDDIFSNSYFNVPAYQVTLNGNLDLSKAGLIEIPTENFDGEALPYKGSWENKDDRYTGTDGQLTSAKLMALYGNNSDTRPQGNITYIWEPSVLPIKGQPVTVHYQDESGTTLQADSSLTGDAGETYTITPPTIKGYQYVENSDVQLTGKYSETDAIDVTLVYRLQPTPPVTPTTPGTSTDSSSSSSSESETSTPDETNGLPVARKDRTITAVKKLGLYRTPDFSKKTRQFYYAKQTRTKRPQFVITGVAQSKNGTKRYLVRDVTPNSKWYGKTGYITARKAFTVHTYYQATPKAVKVIGTKGANAYRSVTLKGHAKHYKRGMVLRVKKLKQHNLTTRLQLTNGRYMTANKNLVIQK